MLRYILDEKAWAWDAEGGPGVFVVPVVLAAAALVVVWILARADRADRADRQAMPCHGDPLAGIWEETR